MSRNQVRNQLWNMGWKQLFVLFGIADKPFQIAHDIAARKLLRVSRGLAIMPAAAFMACATFENAINIAMTYGY